MKIFIRLLCFLCIHACAAKRYIVSMDEESVNADVAIVDSFKIGDYKGYFIESERSETELMKSGRYLSIQEDLQVSLDPIMEISLSETEKYQWGLDRIDQRKLPLDNKKFKPSGSGNGIRVYVLDTGINIKHVEFNGRAKHGWSAYSSTTDDGYGHGTHVASIIAGENIGVAKRSLPIAVKVLSDTGVGTYSNIIKGIEWSVNHALSNNYCGVLNLSLGGPKNIFLNEIIDNAVKQGLYVIVAAGNDYVDACYKSPASAEYAITVGSTNRMDEMSYFSNYGKCVDIFAPGSYIYGAWIGSSKTYKTISGTSMSAPHVTGALALQLQDSECLVDVKKFVQSISNSNRVKLTPSGTVKSLLMVDRCPVEWAVSLCNAKYNGKIRNETSCKKFSLCEWCEVGQCHPKGFCNTKYNDCPRLIPKPKPKPKPTPEPTPEPTSEPTSLSVVTKYITVPDGLYTFNLDTLKCKIHITGVNVSYSRKGMLYTFTNVYIKKDSSVVMTIIEFSNGFGIPYVLISNISNGYINFYLANTDHNNKIQNMDIIVDFVIIYSNNM